MGNYMIVNANIILVIFEALKCLLLNCELFYNLNIKKNLCNINASLNWKSFSIKVSYLI